MKFEAVLCRRVESLIPVKKARIKMDGRTGKVLDVETGVPQGSPTSAILFVINHASIFKKEERDVPDVTMLSFVDHVTGVV
jgi:hypothetical protein